MPKQKEIKKELSDWEASMEEFFTKKLPELPKNAKEVLVKYGPWISLVVAILGLPTLLLALGLGAVLMPVTMGVGYGYGYGYNVAWWLSVASMGLSAWAIPGLFKRQASAWKLMFYSTLVMALYDLVTFSWGSLIIGTAISLYILFQIKSYYK